MAINDVAFSPTRRSVLLLKRQRQIPLLMIFDKAQGLLENITCELAVIQQATMVRCTPCDQDRRVLDPASVVEVRFFRPSANSMRERLYISACKLIGLFLFVGLVEPGQEAEIDKTANGTYALSGTVVSSPYEIVNPDTNDTAVVFVFPDLGICRRGRYQLKFSLTSTRDETWAAAEIASTRLCTRIPSKWFPLSSRLQFRLTWTEATPLTVALKKAGVPIRVRGVPRKRKRTKRKANTEEVWDAHLSPSSDTSGSSELLSSTSSRSRGGRGSPYAEDGQSPTVYAPQAQLPLLPSPFISQMPTDSSEVFPAYTAALLEEVDERDYLARPPRPASACAVGSPYSAWPSVAKFLDGWKHTTVLINGYK
ncbi:velvet factor-domain-containing protein [Mycena rebaudengoi]|nr:velvet factor-domain-containing protein [Mycena rebaudengoi]